MKNSTFPLFFFWQINVGLAGGDWKILISDLQSQFSMSKIIRIFLIFFFIEEYDFRGTLFVIDIFWKLHFFKPLYFLKWRPIENISWNRSVYKLPLTFKKSLASLCQKHVNDFHSKSNYLGPYLFCSNRNVLFKQ